MPPRNKILLSIFLCLTIALGCSDTKENKETKKGLSKESPLLIGLIPEQNIFDQLHRYEPLGDYITKKTGIPIHFKVLTRYGNIIENFAASGLDGAFFGSFTYTLAHSKLGVEVIARPEYISGVSTYHGLLFVRKDSGIKGINDMKGKTFVFVDKATTAGYLLPMAYFKKHGIHDYKSFFKETYFAGTHENAILDVLNKRADIGAAKNTIFDKLVNKNSRIKNELNIIDRSDDVPENGLAVRKDLSAPRKELLKQTLLNMDNDPEGMDVLTHFGCRKFIETTEDDYVNVYKLVQQIGLDLARYDYINE